VTKSGATQTKLLLMDEPTNELDIPSKGQFRRMNSVIYVLTPFFWIVSYFRLTEKQI